jgi:hypothetical protein
MFVVVRKLKSFIPEKSSFCAQKHTRIERIMFKTATLFVTVLSFFFSFLLSSSSSFSRSSVAFARVVPSFQHKTLSSSFSWGGKSFKWETCEEENDDDENAKQTTKDIELTSVTLTPDPVRTGGTAKFRLQGNVMAEMIPETSVIDVEILYQSVPLYTDTLSLCETIRGDETDPSQPTKCPIEKRTGANETKVTMEYDAVVPELAPSGEFEARLVGKRTEKSAGGDVFCVKATLRVKGPFL